MQDRMTLGLLYISVRTQGLDLCGARARTKKTLRKYRSKVGITSQMIWKFAVSIMQFSGPGLRKQLMGLLLIVHTGHKRKASRCLPLSKLAMQLNVIEEG